MKNIKRLFTLVMALAMVLSCTAVASAAEIPENDNEAVVCELFSESDVMSPASVQMYGLTDQITVQPVQANKNKSGFLNTVTEPSYITIVMACQAACTVTITTGDGSASKYIPAGGGKYTICAAEGHWIRYKVDFHSDAPAAVFQFFATETYHNG